MAGYDPDSYYLGGPARPGDPDYADVPEVMVPGLQPWQTGEPVGEPVADDWRRERFEEVSNVGWSHRTGWGEPDEQPDQPIRCGWCRGEGCHRCGMSGWEL